MMSKSLRRWGVVLFYTLVAVIAAPSCAQAWHLLANTLLKTEWPLVLLLRYMLGLAVLTTVIVKLAPRSGHFRHQRWLRFPPLSLSVPLGGLIAWILAELCRGMPSGLADVWYALAFGCAALSALGLFWLIFEICFGSRSCSHNHNDACESDEGVLALPKPSPEPNKINVKRVLAWARDESPISQQSEDWLDVSHRARRVVDALLTRRIGSRSSRRSQTVVIQGWFGSGKSSLVRMVSEEAKRRDATRLVFVEMNCWGFDSGTQVIEHVLTRCVDALHEHIDCTALRSAPSDYARAVSSNSSGWAGALVQGLFSATTPAEQIERFAPLLNAVNLQLVAVIEDTDRNTEGLASGQIEAMLHHFRSVDRMSFILTAGEKSLIEFPKIAEHIEFLPPLRKEMSLPLIDALRTHFLAATDWVDPVRNLDPVGNVERNRPAALWAEAESTTYGWRIFGIVHPAWVDGIAMLITTPRALKAIIRSYTVAWDVLKGEVDIDELLMVVTLRHAAPGVFSFVGRHLNQLRSLARSATRDEALHARVVADLKDEWRAICEKGEFPADAALGLVAELLPAFATAMGHKYFTHGNRVQSLRNEEGPDYWERLTAERLDGKSIMDQSVMAALVASGKSSKDANALGDWMCSEPKVAELVAFFTKKSSLFKGCELQILSGFLGVMRARHGNQATRELPAFQSLGWGRTSRFQVEAEKLHLWLEAEIRACFPKHLRLACDLYGDHAHESSAAPRFRSLLLELTQLFFEKCSGSMLADALDPVSPWTLNNLFFAYGANESEQMLTRGEDWKFLMPVLLDGMRTNPNVLVPTAVFTFFQIGAGVSMGQLDFRDDVVQDFLGEKKGEFYAIIAGFNPHVVQFESRYQVGLERAVVCAEARVRTARTKSIDEKPDRAIG